MSQQSANQGGEAALFSLGTFKVRNAVFWYGLALAFLSLAWPSMRYLFYTLPFLVILTLLGDRESRLGDEAKPFLAICAAGIMFSPLATVEGIKDIFFVLSGVSIALLVDIPKLRTWNLFWLAVLSMLIYFVLVRNIRGGFELDIAASKSTFEGSFGFIFGLLAVFALLERRYRLFLLCAVLTILSLKRIALLGVLIATLLAFLGEKRGRALLNPPVMVLLNSLVVVALLLYGFGTMDSLIRDTTGQTANQLGMGREQMLVVPASSILHHPYHFIAYGEGPGAGYSHLMQWLPKGKENLHSDLVKILYEYGYLLFCGFIWLMYSPKGYNSRVLFLYLNVLFCTDNTLIYGFFVFLFVALARHVPSGDISEAKMPVVGRVSLSH